MKQDHFYWHRRALDSIAQGYLTNSKRPETHVKGITPTHLKSGKGCHVWDWQGKAYVDFICGLGTNLLGYANERVNAAMAEQMTRGASLSFATTLEVETAEKLKELFPFCQAVKFLKSGSEACSAAVRIARAATGREIVVSEGYHGHHAEFVSLTPPAVGVPDVILRKPVIQSQDEDARPIESLDTTLSNVNSDVAAVIVEPIITDHSRERIEWLKKLREDCTRHGVMLIFDEVITGFRYQKYSVANCYGIEPDLIVLGKAIANGMPLAAVGGKYTVMSCDEYFISSTYAGETLSLAAAYQTMKLLQTKYSIDELWLRGQDFLDQFNAIWPEGVRIEGYATRGRFEGEPLTKALFFQEMCKAGVLFGPSWFFNFPLMEEYKSVLNLCQTALVKIKAGGVKLEGEMPKSPFAEKVRAKQ